jgi:hypothetical protein
MRREGIGNEEGGAEGMSGWSRKHWRPGGGDAFVCYAVFGQAPTTFDVDGKRYRTRGLPEGIEVRSFPRSDHPTYVENLNAGYPWDQFVAENPSLAALVREAPDCLVVAGTIPDPDTLAYLRDAVGLTMFLLDNGSLAVHDLQTLTWFDSKSWHDRIFDVVEPDPRQHVVILWSEDEKRPDRLWFHTRGLRKFGRPDVSVRDVPHERRAAAQELCQRFIELQAFGGLVDEGQTIRTDGLPPGGVVRHAGSLDDFEFNNVHFEVEWPPGSW